MQQAVLDKLEDYSEKVLEKVIISTNEKFVDPSIDGFTTSTVSKLRSSCLTRVKMEAFFVVPAKRTLVISLSQ